MSPLVRCRVCVGGQVVWHWGGRTGGAQCRAGVQPLPSQHPDWGPAARLGCTNVEVGVMSQTGLFLLWDALCMKRTL